MENPKSATLRLKAERRRVAHLSLVIPRLAKLVAREVFVLAMTWIILRSNFNFELQKKAVGGF